MRKLVAAVATIAAVFVSGSARAATVDLFLTQTGHLATTWNFTATVHGSVTLGSVAVTIASATAGAFVVAQPASVIDPLIPTGFSNYVVGPPMRLGLGPGTQGYMVNGPTTPSLDPLRYGTFMIGTWTGSSSPTLGPADPGDGDTATDADFNALDFTIHTIVPEPSEVFLIAIGIAVLSLARRRAF